MIYVLFNGKNVSIYSEGVFIRMAVDYDSKKYLESVDAYWRAANYLSVGTLFLMGDPLLRQPLKAEDVKPKPIGHWGTIVPEQ